MNIEQAQDFALSYISEGTLSGALNLSKISSIKNKAKYYVYLLLDPKTDKIFYIGKGTKDRSSHHVKSAKKGKIGNINKHKAIMSIILEDRDVSEVIICDTDSEDHAYKIERVLINTLFDYGITNYKKGVTTDKERARELAKLFKNKVKSFEDWVRYVDTRQADAAISIYGSLKECHNTISREIDMYANGDFRLTGN